MDKINFVGADLSREMDLDAKRLQGVADYSFGKGFNLEGVKKFLAKSYGIKLTAKQEVEVERRLKWLEGKEREERFKDSSILEN